jgi:DNA-formamidopyrimidine glycosylase
MPEGHTIHRLARDQQELVGHVITVTSPQRRFDREAAQLNGQLLEVVEAKGKHLVHHFGEAGRLHVHLGMQGKFLRDATGRPPLPQARVRLELAGGELAWELVAPSTCELLDQGEISDVLGRLGADPLRADADAPAALRRLAQDGRGIGEVLLDQSVIAGAGNVFRAEVLFACGIHPRRPATTLTEAETACLWDTLATMMTTAVEEGRILTVPTPSGVDRSALAESEARWVYKQDRCRRCETKVEVETVGGRTSYACPSCQPSTR